jgi:glutathione peroxidase
MKILSLFVIAFLGLSYSIYDYQVTDTNGNTINLNDFQGKKILFVNTASNSKYVDQYNNLEQLYQKFKDSLVIIALPSNDFGNEPLDNDSIKSFVMNTYKIHYVLAGKASVTGDSIAPVYKWLTDSSLNHVFHNPVFGDFYKFLVDEHGNIIGLFNGSTDPMDTDIQNLIQNQ